MRYGFGWGFGYGGAARAMSPWTPATLGAKLLSWHDEVSTFDANGWAATGGTAVPLLSRGTAVQPTTGSRAGRRTIVFNGTSQSLSAAFTRAMPTETWTAGRWIGPQSATLARRLYAGGTGASGGLRRPPTAAGTNNIATMTSSNNVLAAAFGSPLDDRWAVIGAVFNGADSSCIEDGVDRVTGDVGTGSPGGLTLGSGAPPGFGTWGPCEHGEVITTTGLLTPAERASLRDYLAAKWLI